MVDVHMAGYSAVDIAKVKGGNLERLLDWPQVTQAVYGHAFAVLPYNGPPIFRPTIR